MNKNRTLVYVALALGITWLFWIPALVLVSAKGYPLPTIDYLLQHRAFPWVNGEHTAAVILFSLAVYGPLVGALAASALEGGRKRVRAWFAPALRWQVPLRWYGIVVLLALALGLVPVLVGALAGLVAFQGDRPFPTLPLLLGLLLYQLLTSGLGEEPGWRGYLMPSLKAQYGDEKAIWWTGLLWALWHFPFTIYYTLQAAPDLPFGAQLSMVLPALAGQTMSLIGMTYIYAWLLDHTGSVLIAMLLHALGNTVNAVVNASVIANPIISLAIGAMPWLIVLLLERTKPRVRPAPQPR